MHFFPQIMDSKCLVLSKQENTHKAKIDGYPFLIPNFMIQLLGLGQDQGFAFLTSYQMMLMLSEAYCMRPTAWSWIILTIFCWEQKLVMFMIQWSFVKHLLPDNQYMLPLTCPWSIFQASAQLFCIHEVSFDSPDGK